ncbi:MAG: hypothetical protein DRP45_07155, partial [Candidatus Zixiibacteriota bacterium]
MDNELIKKILDDSVKLYSPPQTLVEVLRLTKDETSTADELAAVLVKDPVVTTRILRVVNSPYYGAARKIGSVSQAVVMIGMRQVTALVLATSIYGLTEKWESVLDRVRFWRHSLEVAIASRNIAEEIGFKGADELFVAGLLHDFGMLIMDNSFPDKFREIWEESQDHGGMIDLEETFWGTNHARVGQFVLEQWQLPDMICESVGHHHNVFISGTDDEELIPSQIVNLANRISQFPVRERQVTDAGFEKENCLIIAGNLGLSSSDLLNIQKELFSQTISESKYLEFDVGSTDDILLEANRLLFEQYMTVESLLEENRRMNQQTAGEQVKRGFLEAFKGTTSAFTVYLGKASASILERAHAVQSGLDSGAIVDPGGLVASSVKSIVENVETVNSIMRDIVFLSQTEPALYY